MSEAEKLLAEFETGSVDAVMDGDGVVLRRVDGRWYRSDRKRPRAMTSADLLRQLCPDLAGDIDEIERTDAA